MSFTENVLCGRLSQSPLPDRGIGFWMLDVERWTFADYDRHMAAWFWYAVAAAILYGAHQIFIRLAAVRIGEGLGGFVVEATAALSILLYLASLWLTSRLDQKWSGEGFFWSVLTGVCVGAGTIAFFLLF